MYRVAVLDDDENWLFAIKRYLRGEFEVTTFNHVYSFIEQADRYDLLILDLCLPSDPYEQMADGRLLIRQIRQRLPNPPILVLATAYVSRTDVETAERFCPEADAFLSKDAGLDRIAEQLRQILNQAHPWTRLQDS